MRVLLERFLQPQAWPTVMWAAMLAGLIFFLHLLASRPLMSKAVPKIWNADDLPILGAWRFYTHRQEMYHAAQESTATGNFSIFVGRKHLVAVNGPEGRRAFFDSKGLSLVEGNNGLYAGLPEQPKTESESFDGWFTKSLAGLLKSESFNKNVALLAKDARHMYEALSVAPVSDSDPEWRVMNPFDSMWRLVYKLTTRTIGAREIAEDPELLNHTLDIFSRFEETTSTLKLFVPWLPTPNYIIRIYNGARLYKILHDIVQHRKKTGKRVDDALQYLLDTGASLKDVISFEIGALFAGQINSGVHASYIPIYCAENLEWKAKVRAEVDGVIAKYRTTPDQSPVDVLDSLPIEIWENEFPLIDLSLRESIRIGMPGTGFRKNTSGRDILLGNTGEAIPQGSYVAYLFNNVHMNPDIYTSPHKFDPSRYLDDRAEDKKMQHAYLGWGSGRHPCLGMRFAKLEMILSNAYLFAMFDFELSEKDGSPRNKPVPPVDVNLNQVRKPVEPIFIRYKPRMN